MSCAGNWPAACAPGAPPGVAVLVLGSHPQGADQHQLNSVAELRYRIDGRVAHWNDNPEPFTWTRTADEIIDKVTRGRAALNRITTSATHH